MQKMRGKGLGGMPQRDIKRRRRGGGGTTKAAVIVAALVEDEADAPVFHEAGGAVITDGSMAGAETPVLSKFARKRQRRKVAAAVSKAANSGDPVPGDG